MQFIFRPLILFLGLLGGLISFQTAFSQCPINVFIQNGDTLWICPGDTATLVATPGLQNYQWTTTETSSSILVSAAGVFGVNSTNNGCTSYDYITVLMFSPPPQVILTVSGTVFSICEGDTFHLGVANLVYSSFLWNYGGHTEASRGLDSTGIYWIVGYDQNGCRDTSNFVTLIVQPNPAVSLGADTTICSGDTLFKNAGNGYASYSWENGDTNQIHPITTPGAYWVRVWDGNGCTALDAFSVNQIPSPQFSIGNDTVICRGNTILLDAGAGFASYAWSTSATSRSIVVTESGTYSVSVIGTNGCDSQLEMISVTVDSPAFPSISQFGDNLIASGGAAPYTWYYNDTLAPGLSSGTVYPLGDGTYYVMYYSPDGCPAKSEPFELFVKIDPIEGFSPNGDGKGDFFKILFIDLFPESELKIFNRWGKLVYEATGYQNNWNGVSMDGIELPDGTYFFTLDVKDGRKVIADYLTLNR